MICKKKYQQNLKQNKNLRIRLLAKDKVQQHCFVYRENSTRPSITSTSNLLNIDLLSLRIWKKLTIAFKYPSCIRMFSLSFFSVILHSHRIVKIQKESYHIYALRKVGDCIV